MRSGVSLYLKLLPALLFFFCLHESNCKSLDAFPDFRSHEIPLSYQQGSVLMDEKENALLPDTSPSSTPQPFIPLLAPSPLPPFINNSVPILSGLCTLNFSTAESMIRMTSVDCWAIFAPFLANVICCPQLQATLTILIGQSSKDTGTLALDMTHANHCLSDFQQILVGRGANRNLRRICSIQPSNLTEASCPVKDVKEFESSVDSTTLLAACSKVDPVNECCTQICQNAVLEAATKIALKVDGQSALDDDNILSKPSYRIDDCKSIALRYVASRLDPLAAKQVLRRISNCNLNKVCPLVFPDTRNVEKYCGHEINNQTACCNTMENYISHLQKQSFITNLQALDCAALLGTQLQKVNITKNIYSLCQITLKDFSVQVGSKESGCLLPSLPSDATFDKSSGISFTCDLNDNIAAPWPSTSQLASVSSCNKTVKFPALPAATSAPSDPNRQDMILPLIVASFMVVTALL
ncbi:putative GPI-anchored protein At1g61900 [Tasmannia lanceolata]|uniref:putative GPI-anchored protein At1g61900 n=1 Tax=Tasmannia lanceolata TaxID=3420 RepID=UPI004062A58A